MQHIFDQFFGALMIAAFVITASVIRLFIVFALIVKTALGILEIAKLLARKPEWVRLIAVSAFSFGAGAYVGHVAPLDHPIPAATSDQSIIKKHTRGTGNESSAIRAHPADAIV